MLHALLILSLHRTPFVQFHRPKYVRWPLFNIVNIIFHRLTYVLYIHTSKHQRTDEQDGFKGSMKAAFEHFINLKHNSSAALIAKYVDRKLRGEKGTTEEEVERALDQVGTAYIHVYTVCVYCMPCDDNVHVESVLYYIWGREDPFLSDCVVVRVGLNVQSCENRNTLPCPC